MQAVPSAGLERRRSPIHTTIPRFVRYHYSIYLTSSWAGASFMPVRPLEDKKKKETNIPRQKTFHHETSGEAYSQNSKTVVIRTFGQVPQSLRHSVNALRTGRRRGVELRKRRNLLGNPARWC